MLLLLSLLDARGAPDRPARGPDQRDLQQHPGTCAPSVQGREVSQGGAPGPWRRASVLLQGSRGAFCTEAPERPA